MTDKQIIIHGVDVSGCEFYSNNGWCCCALVYDDYCKDFNKCIYKLANKLEAKEQECEELKEQLKEMNEVIRTETTRCNLVNILKTELDQLKAENKHLNDLLNQALKELEELQEGLENG
jgi:septal ring factor EnvC (AmiA/AmiB activator)